MSTNCTHRLGCTFNADGIHFALWAPSAQQVSLCLYHKSSHSVNYVESHDGYTLGDFIRLALKQNQNHQQLNSNTSHGHENEQDNEHAIIDRAEHEVIRLQKLAGFMLFVSQGVCMIHAGQEWARSKVLEPATIHQDAVYDHDSYNKDSDVNYLDFDKKDSSLGVFDYYRRLIELRKSEKALRNSSPEAIVFKVYQDSLHITFSIDGESTGSLYTYFISINCNRYQSYEIILPEGKWELVLTEKLVPKEKFVEHTYLVPYSAGVLLRQKRS